MNEWDNYFPENNKSNHASLTNNDLENIKEINEFFIKKNTNSLICLNVTTKKKFLIVNHHNKKIWNIIWFPFTTFQWYNLWGLRYRFLHMSWYTCMKPFHINLKSVIYFLCANNRTFNGIYTLIINIFGI